MFSKAEFSIRATIKLLTELEGGRKTAPGRGYSPQIQIFDFFTTCRLEPVGREEYFELGREYEVSISFPIRQLETEEILSLRVVKLYEGSKLVGLGRRLSSTD
jgi:hypothetical protein